MLVPLRVGLPVEIEPPSGDQAPGSAPRNGRDSAAASPAILAQVTGCECNADGLFRIRLSFQRT